MSTTFFSKGSGPDMVHIFVRVQYRGLELKMATPYFMESKIWERRNDRSYMRKYKSDPTVQKVLDIMEDIIEKCEAKLKLENVHDKEVIKRTILNCIYGQKDNTLHETNETAECSDANKVTLRIFTKKFLEEAKNGQRLTEGGTVYTYGTLCSIKQSVDHLRKFEKSVNKEYDFNDINMAFYKDYVAFLNQQNYALNTIGKNINWLKTLMNVALVEDFHHNQIFKDKRFKGARIDVDSIYLTKEDLDKIRAVNLNDKSYGYDLARDIFMIGVWTAQRVSDYNNINREDIQERTIKKIVNKEDPEHPGQTISYVITKKILVLNITQRKTGTKVYIPCSTELRMILEKYDFNIPRLSDQNVNDNMKKIAMWAGLDEPIRIDYVEGGHKKHVIKKKYELVHTHTARRTGATLMYLSGMNIMDIMKITGHSTPQTLKKYIKADQLEIIDKIVIQYDYFD